MKANTASAAALTALSQVSNQPLTAQQLYQGAKASGHFPTLPLARGMAKQRNPGLYHKKEVPKNFDSADPIQTMVMAIRCKVSGYKVSFFSISNTGKRQVFTYTHRTLPRPNPCFFLSVFLLQNVEHKKEREARQKETGNGKLHLLLLWGHHSSCNQTPTQNHSSSLHIHRAQQLENSFQ